MGAFASGGKRSVDNYYSYEDDDRFKTTSDELNNNINSNDELDSTINDDNAIIMKQNDKISILERLVLNSLKDKKTSTKTNMNEINLNI